MGTLADPPGPVKTGDYGFDYPTAHAGGFNYLADEAVDSANGNFWTSIPDDVCLVAITIRTGTCYFRYGVATSTESHTLAARTQPYWLLLTKSQLIAIELDPATACTGWITYFGL
ncbi:MAG TPA: hypothetical protein PKA27_02275 [Fimbriimonadaceae bacterium]|nr:hypothetical protein [Fimbriimonadaceae bacterium]